MAWNGAIIAPADGAVSVIPSESSTFLSLAHRDCDFRDSRENVNTADEEISGSRHLVEITQKCPECVGY